MAQRREFEFGDAVLFVDSERSVHQADFKRFPTTPRTVTLFVKSPGSLFGQGTLRNLQNLLKKVCSEDVLGNASIVGLNDRKIIINERSITSYSAGVDVAEEVVGAFNERYNQVLAAEAQQAKSMQ